MQPTSTICRAQEQIHRDRAASSSLPNARLVATRAAQAWAQEALVAERREDRRLKVEHVRSLLLEQGEGDAPLAPFDSENPDRALADRAEPATA